jgi:DNA-binding IclR family transcriptional regulator
LVSARRVRDPGPVGRAGDRPFTSHGVTVTAGCEVVNSIADLTTDRYYWRVPPARRRPPPAVPARATRTDDLGRPARERRGGTLEAGLDILEVLANSAAGGLGVTELARQLDLDKGNVHRLLQVLAHKGYAQQDPGSRQWSVTVQLVALARGVLRTLDVRAAAEPEVRALVDQTGEAAHLALRTRTGGVYIAQERPYGRVSVETEVGTTPVVHATATGKALLAWLDRAEWRALVRTPLPRCTSRTITTLTALDQELATVRARGYAVDDEEYQADVRCVAAPIFDHRVSVVASIGVSCPADRLPKARLGPLGATVRAAAARVTKSLGGAPMTEGEDPARR